MRVNPVFAKIMSNWAYHRREGLIKILSYPGSSPIAGFIDNPPVKCRQKECWMKVPKQPRGKPKTPGYISGDNARHAQRVQDIISELNEKQRNAIWCRWVGKEGSGMDEDRALVALGIGRSAYYDRLRQAHRYIGDRLNVTVAA